MFSSKFKAAQTKANKIGSSLMFSDELKKALGSTESNGKIEKPDSSDTSVDETVTMLAKVEGFKARINKDGSLKPPQVAVEETHSQENTTTTKSADADVIGDCVASRLFNTALAGIMGDMNFIHINNDDGLEPSEELFEAVENSISSVIEETLAPFYKHMKKEFSDLVKAAAIETLYKKLSESGMVFPCNYTTSESITSFGITVESVKESFLGKEMTVRVLVKKEGKEIMRLNSKEEACEFMAVLEATFGECVKS